MDQINPNFRLTMCKRAIITILALFNVTRVMGTELLFIGLELVQLLHPGMCLWALLPQRAFLPDHDMFAHDVRVEVSEPLAILCIMIINTVFMGMGFGVVTGMKLEVVKVEILRVGGLTLTIYVWASL